MIIAYGRVTPILMENALTRMDVIDVGIRRYIYLIAKQSDMRRRMVKRRWTILNRDLDTSELQTQ